MISAINFNAYIKIAQITSKIDQFMMEAMAMKGRINNMPLLEPGVGNRINILA